MACIKCGKDVTNGGEFCEECLAEMEQYPIKPDTPVTLPKREDYSTVKHTRKRAVKSEVQIAHLKKLVGWLAGISAVLLLLTAVAVVLIIRLMDGDPTSLLP